MAWKSLNINFLHPEFSCSSVQQASHIQLVFNDKLAKEMEKRAELQLGEIKNIDFRYFMLSNLAIPKQFN